MDNMKKTEVLDKNKYKLFSDSFSKTKIILKQKENKKIYISEDKDGRSN